MKLGITSNLPTEIPLIVPDMYTVIGEDVILVSVLLLKIYIRYVSAILFFESQIEHFLPKKSV